MKPSLQAIRSISSELAARLYLPVAISAVVGIVALLVLSVWLVTLSQWWWILLIMVSVVLIVVLILLSIAGVIIKSVAPLQSKDQKRQTKALVDKIQHLSEVTMTPKFVLLFQVVKDSVFPTEKGFIASITSDTTSLKKDFTDLRDSFKE